MNREPKCCMEWLIQKLPSISTTTKSFKIPKIEYIYNRLPINTKSHFGRLGPLGINYKTIDSGCYGKNNRSEEGLEDHVIDYDIAPFVDHYNTFATVDEIVPPQP